MASRGYFKVDFPVVGDDEWTDIERVRGNGSDDEVVILGHHDWSAYAK